MKGLLKAASAGPTEDRGATPIPRALAALALAAGFALFLSLAPGAQAAPWGFEQVTPPVKGAGALAYVDTFQASPDGESFLYTNNSAWTSIPAESAPAYIRYLGWRGPESWHSVSLDPPFETGPWGAGPGGQGSFDIMGVSGSSFNLRYALVATSAALTPGAIEGGGNLYMRDTKTRELTLIASDPHLVMSRLFNTLQGELSVKYVAPDGKAAIFMAQPALVPGAPERAEEITKPGATYSWTAEDGLKAVTVMPESEGGEIVGGGVIGNENEAGPRDSMPHEGGLEHIYFQTFANSQAGGIYVREGETTKPVSYSRIPGAPTTVVKGVGGDAVSNHGEYLLFHSKTRLTEDTPETPLGSLGALYRYDAADESLEYIGIDGGGGTVHVIQMTQDGKTIAFQSDKALPVVGSATPVAGKPNVYVWQEGKPALKLAATLDGGTHGSSEAKALRMLSENGSYLAFTDNSVSLLEEFGQATASPSCPTMIETPGPCDEVFVYDVEAEKLECASCRADGAPQAGYAGDALNKNQGYMRLNTHQMRNVADDGTVFFTTFDGLLPADENELEDAYAYDHGELRLLSRATNGRSARFLDATPDGKTIFISTDDPISPTDIDNSVDVYMTRSGAGYPYTPAAVLPPCGGIEGCHDGVPAAPAQSSPGSSTFAGQGNEVPRSRRSSSGVAVLKAKAVRGATARLRVRVPDKGTLTVSGHGIKKVKIRTAKAATYKVKVRLTGKAKRALRRSGHVKQRLKVAFKPSQGKASQATVRLTFKAPAGKRGQHS